MLWYRAVRTTALKHCTASIWINRMGPVLEQAARRPLSELLLYRQLILYGRVAMLRDDAPQRRVVFEASSLCLRSSQCRRGRGRPRQQWAQCVHVHARMAAGTHDKLVQLLMVERSTASWAAIAKKHSTCPTSYIITTTKTQ